MKTGKRLLSTFLSFCMIASITAPAFAAEPAPQKEPVSTAVPLVGGNNKIIDFPVTQDCGYWKIAIQNTGSADLRFEITKDSPNGEVVYPNNGRMALVNAGTTQSFYAPKDSPLEAGSYYILVQSRDGGIALNGMLWHKCAGFDLTDPADALPSYQTTSNVTVPLGGAASKTIAFPAGRGFGFWKIAIQNTGTADISFEITKDTPDGEIVYSDSELDKRVEAGTTKSVYCPKDAPLDLGVYYLNVRSGDGGVNLNGTLWYKFATEDIKTHE